MRSNLYVIPATDRLAQTKVEMIASAAVDQVVRQMTRRKGADNVPVSEILEHRLADAKQAFTFIIIDCPPTLDLLQDSVYDFAHAAIVPVKVDYLGAAGAAQHTQGILEAQADGIDIKVEMIVPTFVRSRQRLARQMLQTLKDTYGAKRVSEPVPTSVKVEEAPASGGRTIFEYAPG
ncbi:MAG: ParA family protein [Anaerolineae bacterium]|nr:ParA family protein [Anaerolineae bacterium]